MAQKNHVCKFEGCGHVCQTKRGLKKHSFAHKSKTVKTGRAADKDLSDGTRAKMRKKSHGVEDPGAYVPSPGRNWVANEERRQTKKRKKEAAQQTVLDIFWRFIGSNCGSYSATSEQQKLKLTVNAKIVILVAQNSPILKRSLHRHSLIG